MLRFDASSAMSMLNEAFEDSFLNDHEDDAEEISVYYQGVSINRQYIISILLRVMNPVDFEASSGTIYLDMFIARNLPKYPQYILLSGTTLQQVLVRLCQYPDEEMADDCQLSAEYLLSIYHPPDIRAMIPLFKEAQFFRILKSTYRVERMYPQLILTYLEDQHEQEAVFTCVQDCLRPGSKLSKVQRRNVEDTVKSQAGKLVGIDVIKAAQAVQAVAPEMHATFLGALRGDPRGQYRYLAVLIEPPHHAAVAGRHSPVRTVGNWMIERYVQLLCRYKPSQVAGFIDNLRTGDVRIEEVLPSIEERGVVDAAVILLARQGQVRAAMNRLIAHFGTLQSGLMGVLQGLEENPDSESATEAIDDLVESLNKYARVGTWLCQSQAKMAAAMAAQAAHGRDNAIKVNGSRRIAAIVEQPLNFEENLWLDLIEAVVRIASSVFSFLREMPSTNEIPPLDDLTVSFRGLVQQVFTTLLSSTLREPSGPSSATTVPEQSDVIFLRILRSFLGRAAAWSPSLFELRAVLASIFSAYAYEKSLLSLANSMLDRDLFTHVDEATRLRQRGWRPRGQACEICRRQVWGPGAGMHYWEAWEKQRSEDQQKRIAKITGDSVDPAAPVGKGKAVAVGGQSHDDRGRIDGNGVEGQEEGEGEDEATVSGPVVVFSCRHMYHQQCLLGECQTQQDMGDAVCPVCR